MVLIDTVYQKVLAIANKEQRGYITPQEFNLFADQAQKEILDQYFYDINQFGRVPGNDTVHSDMLDTLEDKLALFEFWAVDANTKVSNIWGDIDLTQFPNLYRLTEVRVNYGDGYVICEEVTLKEFRKYAGSPLTKYNEKRPVFMHYHHGYDRVKVYPHPPNINSITNSYMTNGDDIRTSYIKKPTTPNWSYVVVNGYAQYNSGPSVNFELHPSEEGNLILKILQLSGLTMKDVGLYQVAAQEETKDIQQEKQ